MREKDYTAQKPPEPNPKTRTYVEMVMGNNQQELERVERVEDAMTGDDLQEIEGMIVVEEMIKGYAFPTFL